MLRLPIILMSAAIFLSLAVQPVAAQTTKTASSSAGISASSSATASQSATPIMSTEAFEADLRQKLSVLNDQYIIQLSNYRSDEKQYVIAKEQYAKLQTLRSLEDAVQSTRQVMDDRATVLMTYTTILQYTLQLTHGLDPQIQAAQVAATTQLIADLRQHQVAVQAASDRVKLLAVTNNFVLLQKRIPAVTNRTVALIMFGRLQTILNQTAAARDEAKAEIVERHLGTFAQGEKDRGFDEIDRTLEQVTLQQQEVKETIEKNPNSSQSTSSLTTAIQDKLNSTYAGISRTLGFLEEIIK